MSAQETNQKMTVYGTPEQQPYVIGDDEKKREPARQQDVDDQIQVVKSWLETVDNPNLKQVLANEQLSVDRLKITNTLDVSHFSRAHGLELARSYGKAADITLIYPPRAEYYETTPTVELAFAYRTQADVIINILLKVIQPEQPTKGGAVFDFDDEKFHLLLEQVSEAELAEVNEHNQQAVQTLKNFVIRQLEYLQRTS